MQSHDARTTKDVWLPAPQTACTSALARLSCRDTAPARGAHGSCHARPVTRCHAEHHEGRGAQGQ